MLGLSMDASNLLIPTEAAAALQLLLKIAAILYLPLVFLLTLWLLLRESVILQLQLVELMLQC